MTEAAFERLLAGLGSNVRRARDRLGWTQQELANAVGVSQRYIAGIEAGRESPSLRRLHALGLALDEPAGALLRPARGANPTRKAGRPRKRS